MKKHNSWLLLALPIVLAGCNAGNAPDTLKPEDVKAAVDKASPDDQIAWINNSPMPAAEKAKRIAEVKAKAGIK